MYDILYILGVSFGSCYALWIFYLATMALYRARISGTISKTALFFGWPIAMTGVVLDFLVNITIVSVLLLEIPRELLVTRRLHRHLADGSGWRFNIAKFICSKLLDTFDPSGTHCA